MDHPTDNPGSTEAGFDPNDPSNVGRPVEADDEQGRHKEDDQFDRKKPEDDPTGGSGEPGGAGEAA